jgi:hemolysin activation/secretion protein
MRHRIHAFIKPAALVLLAGHLAFGADAPRNLPAREPVRMAEPPSKRPAPMPDNGNEKSTKKASTEKEKVSNNQEFKEEKSKPLEVKVRVNSLDISGHTVFTTPEILTAVQEKIGSELTFSELTGIAEAITRLYQRAG